MKFIQIYHQKRIEHHVRTQSYSVAGETRYSPKLKNIWIKGES